MRDLPLTLPKLSAGNTSVFAQYTVRLQERERVASQLQQHGIPTAVHYPIPLYLQPALRQPETHCAEAERAAAEVMSLPFHPYLTRSEVDQVATALAQALGGD